MLRDPHHPWQPHVRRGDRVVGKRCEIQGNETILYESSFRHRQGQDGRSGSGIAVDGHSYRRRTALAPLVAELQVHLKLCHKMVESEGNGSVGGSDALTVCAEVGSHHHVALSLLAHVERKASLGEDVALGISGKEEVGRGEVFPQHLW